MSITHLNWCGRTFFLIGNSFIQGRQSLSSQVLISWKYLRLMSSLDVSNKASLIVCTFDVEMEKRSWFMQSFAILKNDHVPLAESLYSSSKLVVNYFLNKFNAGDPFYSLRLSTYATFLRILAFLASLSLWCESRIHLIENAPASRTTPEDSFNLGQHKSFTFLNKSFQMFFVMWAMQTNAK